MPLQNAVSQFKCPCLGLFSCIAIRTLASARRSTLHLDMQNMALGASASKASLFAALRLSAHTPAQPRMPPRRRSQRRPPDGALLLLQLPLEQAVLPHLPASALGCLACTCRALRECVLNAPRSIWQPAAAAVLGPVHPVFSSGARTPGLFNACWSLMQKMGCSTHHALCGGVPMQ